VTRPPESDAPAAGGARDDAGPAADAAGPHVVYCGGCNPHIDRGAIAAELAATPTFVRPGARVYLSGCQRACASDHRLALALSADHPDEAQGSRRAPDEPAVVVAGPHVDGVPTPADAIAATVIDKLKE
jgi:hypothetical protein